MLARALPGYAQRARPNGRCRKRTQWRKGAAALAANARLRHASPYTANDSQKRYGREHLPLSVD
jgi:hypothetical protein